MNDASALSSVKSINGIRTRSALHSFVRIAKYVVVKAALTFLSVMVGLYLTILVVNLGGYVDKVFESDVTDAITGAVQGGAFRGMTVEDTADQIWIMRWSMEEEKGLHVPFMLRTWRWFLKSLTLDWKEGNAEQALMFLAGPIGGYLPISTNLLRAFLLDRLPYTLLLIGVSGFLLFIFAVPLALSSSQRKIKSSGLIAVLSSATAAPAWIHGVVLIFLFCTLLGALPYPRFNLVYIDATNPVNLFFFFKSLILPILSIVISLAFQSLYAWRTFFSIYSQEDYVELARAKGLTNRALEREYIFKPTMPYVVTNFAMLMVGMWQNMFALETLFKWPGLGTVMLVAIKFFSVPLLLGMTTFFAYLMALTLVLLDLFYAWIDPRVRIDFSAHNGFARRKIRFPSRGNSRRAPLPKHSLNPSRISQSPREKIDPARYFRSFVALLKNLGRILREIVKQPLGAFGSIVLVVLFGVSLCTALVYPVRQLTRDWRDINPDGIWYENPRNALPVWVNFFRKDELPETIILDSRKNQATKTVEVVSDDLTKIVLSFKFDYRYNEPPQELTIYLHDGSRKKFALVKGTWLMPDGRAIELGRMQLKSPSETYYLSQNESVNYQGKKSIPIETMFVEGAMQGVYELRLNAYLFEKGATFDAEAALYGKVFGFAGTDPYRRDLTLPLLAGLPVALAFGLLGAIATSLLAMTLAALGAWFGGWVDGIIQRLSEVNMTIPTLAVAILVFLLYSNSIWAVLGALVLLSVFGNTLKNYRAAFLQVKSSPYVEAALAQGASDWRIIWKYLVPRIYSTMIPQIAIMAPVYVYYEVTLAFLGISDPVLPTWGRAIFEAIENQAFQFYPHRVLMPMALLLITGMGFALFGSALDRALNPRLRAEE